MNYIVTKQLKNAGLAVLLTMLFGGIGLFYASIWGGIIMTLLFPVVLFLLFISGHFFSAIIFACSYYLICLVWAIIAVRSYNRKVQNNSRFQIPDSTQWANQNIQSDNNYYEQYRKAQQNENTFLWIVLTIIIGALIFYLTYRFLT